MHLKSFRAYGFKSFADKTELSFDKGVTAVVGPNGSGKSNISDAVRWVLGEQSAKYLRGSRMEDVIFSGSKQRRALGVAEVTLNFDNSDGILPLEFDEVSLMRKLYRNGESEYSINKKACRLKDIIDLMADTGLGKGSMSIIAQNRIDEILNSKPEERRALFEEAAGIAKYRLRKKEAMHRLEETSSNLTRINDIKTEVERQVGPLSLAAEKTRQFSDLSISLRQCRLTGFMKKIDSIEDVRSRLQKKKEVLEAEYSSKAAELGKIEAEYSSLQIELDQLSENFTKLQDEVKDKETALEKKRGAKGVLDERIAQSRRAMERLDISNERLNSQAETLEQSMQNLAAEFDALEKVRVAADLKVEQLIKDKGNQEKELEDAKAAAENLQSEFFSAMQELLKIRNELRGLEQDQENRRRRREALKHSIEEAEKISADLENKYRMALDEQVRNEREQEFLGKETADWQEKLDVLQKDIKENQGKQQACQTKLTAAETMEQSLERMQEGYEGFGLGSRFVLQSKEPWRVKIISVVAELIRVEDKYVAAIETALGNSAQNLVTENAAAAKEIIDFLKRRNGGRATFLPLDTLKGRPLTAEDKKLAKANGICGFAADLITIDKKAEKALRFLLGRVLVAENIDTALSVAKSAGYSMRIVTLDGDVVNFGGGITGGSRRVQEGYLSRAKEISKAKVLSQTLRTEMLSWQEQIENLENHVAKTKGKLDVSSKKLQQSRLQSHEIELKVQRIEQEKNQENDRLTLLLDDRATVTKEYTDNRTKVKALQETLAGQEAKDTQAKEMLEKLQKQTASIENALTALENQLQDARVQLETSTGKIGYIEERMQSLDVETVSVRNEIKNNDAEKERLLQVIEGCETKKENLDAESNALMEELQKISGGKDRYGEQRLELTGRQQEISRHVEDAKKSVGSVENRLRQMELEMARQDSDYEHAIEQLGSEYNMDAATAREAELLDLDMKDLRKMESTLTVAIADLGPVNPSAIEEYEAIKERSDFLNKQYTDLCTAKYNLETVISEINSGMTKKFREAFEKINIYFAECYAKLFGGGTAFLKLSTPDDILNSGIDIQAQPPGKKLQSLYLLSGGERALTVIALLFGLLSYQPSPFCILDEIDAPLDDANIARFSDFLHEYAAKTQFIVITHRKGTMECADIMYGVTMDESGVSKLLSVKLGGNEE
ncbi:MAG: chromosome segregation protein SMC [Phascolarctobacterium sp.]|nr:chromosome segregation protein SMC [Phascolarctobacterium sp.]